MCSELLQRKEPINNMFVVSSTILWLEHQFVISLSMLYGCCLVAILLVTSFVGFFLHYKQLLDNFVQLCLSRPNILQNFKLLMYCRSGTIRYILISWLVEVWIMKFVYGMLIPQTVLDHKTSVISVNKFLAFYMQTIWNNIVTYFLYSPGRSANRVHCIPCKRGDSGSCIRSQSETCSVDLEKAKEKVFSAVSIDVC
jgi:hypothetical protein